MSTIQLLHPFNGRSPGLYDLGDTENNRLVSIGLARFYTAGMDGDNPVLSIEQIDVVHAAISAGILDTPAGTRLATISGVPTASILLDAGVGGTVDSARVTFAPPTDTIGAQRLLTPTAETYTLLMDSTRVLSVPALGGATLVMHAIGVSVMATLTGELYVMESDYTLAEVIAGDARFEWLDSVPTKVEVTLQRGSSTRYAVLSVTAQVSA
jgi:hypothetical protein